MEAYVNVSKGGAGGVEMVSALHIRGSKFVVQRGSKKKSCPGNRLKLSEL